MQDNFSERYGPWAVVAGASDGIGASVARLLGARGVNVVLVARRRAALEEVAATVCQSEDARARSVRAAGGSRARRRDPPTSTWASSCTTPARIRMPPSSSRRTWRPGRTSSCATAPRSSAPAITLPEPCGSEATAASSWSRPVRHGPAGRTSPSTGHRRHSTSCSRSLSGLSSRRQALTCWEWCWADGHAGVSEDFGRAPTERDRGPRRRGTGHARQPGQRPDVSTRPDSVQRHSASRGGGADESGQRRYQLRLRRQH